MATALELECEPIENSMESWVPQLFLLVEEIGGASFGQSLLDCLAGSFGISQYSIFRLKDYDLTEVMSAGQAPCQEIPKTDLTPYEVRREFSQLGLGGACIKTYSLGENSDPQRQRQGVMILGRKDDAFYCIRAIRVTANSSGLTLDVQSLREVADRLVLLVAKHIELTTAKPNMSSVLTSLSTIEKLILDTERLSRRESEVCARILYGYSSSEIAGDLGIGKESVMTYRKRAYLNLEMSSRRELLLWYLELAGNMVVV